MPEKISFILNNELISTDVNPAISLVDFIRYCKKLTGTKISCREGDCGSCTVLEGEIVNDNLVYKNINSCIYPLHSANRKHIVTIEGLNSSGLNLIQEEFIINNASQCGFCTPGFIVSLTGFFLSSDVLNIENAIKYISGNICRCTGYFSIKKSVSSLISRLPEKISVPAKRTDELISLNIIPAYFKEIKKRLIPLGEYPRLKDTDEYNYLISGGTDLYVSEYNLVRNSNVKYIVSPAEENVTLSYNKIFINGFASLESIFNSEVMKKHFPNIKILEKYFGSKQIRNRATAAGNIINASPIGDFTIFLLSLDAEIYFRNGYGERKTYLKELFVDYKKLNFRLGETLTKISFDVPPPDSFSNFIKISRRKHLDIASVNSALFFVLDKDVIKKCSVSAGGVAPIPKYLTETSDFLNGKNVCADVFKKAAKIAADEISPISDVRGSAGYKKALLKKIILSHYSEFLKHYEQN
jgi:xanthine dehydrogenase small subunit